MTSIRFIQAAALSCSLALATASCDVARPTEPKLPAAPSTSLLGLSSVLMSCVPLAADSQSAVIGSQGGTINVGAHGLVVPPGALPDDVFITAVAPSSSVNQVSFQPHGLAFAVPARLTLSYANCQGADLLLPKQVAYTTNALAIIELLSSTDNWASRTVSANLDHFSKYAVAW